MVLTCTFLIAESLATLYADASENADLNIVIMKLLCCNRQLITLRVRCSGSVQFTTFRPTVPCPGSSLFLLRSGPL